jgi:hypothetical protein
MGHYPTKCGISDVVVTSIVVSKVTVPPLSRCRGRHDRDDIEMGWRETLQPTLTPCFYNDRKHWSSKTDVIRKKLSFDPALWRLCNSPDWNAESHEARESIKADSEEQIQLFARYAVLLFVPGARCFANEYLMIARAFRTAVLEDIHIP